MQAVVRLQNVAHHLHKYRLAKSISRALEIVIRLVWNAYLPSGAQIHASAHLAHSALGLVINQSSVIGANCHIGPHVVLGGRAPRPGAPALGEGVVVSAGAKLLGPISIGDGSVIGANAVVITDIPERSLVVGMPGRVIKTNISSAEYIGWRQDFV